MKKCQRRIARLFVPAALFAWLLFSCLSAVHAQPSAGENVAPHNVTPPAAGENAAPHNVAPTAAGFVLCLDDESALYPCCAVTRTAPAPADGGQSAAGHELREYPGFALCYRETYEQPEWVSYVLTAAEVRGTVKRANDFREDPSVSTGSAVPHDYYRSGYDRGHLAPAADMKWSPEAMSSSFFMTNMSPQNPAFNRGIWSKLEQMVRDWAMYYGAVAVVSGPVLEKETYPAIGSNQVAVPEYFYKALLASVPDGSLRCCAFILPNEKSSAPLDSYMCTVDELEARTGIDFFSFLPDTEEDIMEAAVFWDFLP